MIVKGMKERIHLVTMAIILMGQLSLSATGAGPSCVWRDAALLFISEETVKGHVKHIMGKLGASDRTEAVAIGIRRGIIQP